MFQILVLYVTTTYLVMGTKLCQKRVPIPSPSKKVHVLRRVPASCSNWEKAWSWITHKDCGTKYRLDLVDLPSQEQVMYKMEPSCCEGDPTCEDGGLEASSGLDVSDEKFLAIVLGSTAAALFVVILIICISLCRKKKQCSLLCEERRHIYASAEEEEESSELQGQKERHLSDEETENKVCESVYAEIDDSGLPRYTDIFKEQSGASEEDPFMRATAPPLYDTRTEGPTISCEPSDTTNVKEVLQGTADILERESQDTGNGNHVEHESEEAASDAKEYYNIPKKSAESAGKKGVSMREEAVMNLTKDDPAVVSAEPPSPTTSPKPLPPRNSTSCDASSEKPSPDQQNNSATHQKCSSLYEQLAHNPDKDCHEYQSLNKNIKNPSTKKCPPDEDSNSVELEMNVCIANDANPEVQISVDGHIESTAEC